MNNRIAALLATGFIGVAVLFISFSIPGGYIYTMSSVTFIGYLVWIHSKIAEVFDSMDRDYRD